MYTVLLFSQKQNMLAQSSHSWVLQASVWDPDPEQTRVTPGTLMQLLVDSLTPPSQLLEQAPQADQSLQSGNQGFQMCVFPPRNWLLLTWAGVFMANTRSDGASDAFHSPVRWRWIRTGPDPSFCSVATSHRARGRCCDLTPVAVDWRIGIKEVDLVACGISCGAQVRPFKKMALQVCGVPVSSAW